MVNLASLLIALLDLWSHRGNNLQISIKWPVSAFAETYSFDEISGRLSAKAVGAAKYLRRVLLYNWSANCPLLSAHGPDEVELGPPAYV